MNDYLKKHPLTKLQEDLLQRIEANKKPVRILFIALDMGYRESAPLYGAVSSLIKKGLIEKVETGRYAKYQSIR